jgi:hypothetical protein
MGWLIVLGVLIVLGLMPIGLRVRYDALGPFAAFVIGPVNIRLYPLPPKRKNVKNKQVAAKSTPKKKSSGGSISDFLPLLKLVLDFLEGFRKRLRINHLRLKLILGGGDPCDLALNYGKGWAVLGNLMPLLERVFVIKKRDLEVECDFTADRTTVIAGADITIRLWHLLVLAITHGPKVLKEYFSVMKIRKGGANT